YGHGRINGIEKPNRLVQIPLASFDRSAKSLDIVNYGYLRKVLNKINFDKKYVNIMNALFLSQQAYIMDSGLLSEPFRVERGALVLNNLLKIIKMYKDASNARVNRSKTMLIPLIVIAQRHNLTSECNFRKVTKDELISILSYKVDSKENLIIHL
ncbi:2898_t:CDS:2, partial [Gigaspora rosea]